MQNNMHKKKNDHGIFGHIVKLLKSNIGAQMNHSRSKAQRQYSITIYSCWKCHFHNSIDVELTKFIKHYYNYSENYQVKEIGENAGKGPKRSFHLGKIVNSPKGFNISFQFRI